MKGDVSLYLAIESVVQHKMFSCYGMRLAKDLDLAEIFEVDIKELRESIGKNIVRFPLDFMIEKNEGEYAFTEPGIIMLGGLLKSKRAIKAHIQFIEYFVHLANENGLSIFDLVQNLPPIQNSLPRNQFGQ